MAPTHSGSFRQADQPDPPGWVDGAPTSAIGAHCTFCGHDATWVHPLDPDKTTYRAWGEGYTLPTFWVLCDECEALYQSGDDEALAGLMAKDSPSIRELDEDGRKPVAVFRAADKGARRFADPQPEIVRLRQKGFEPLHAYTGITDELGSVWPEANRVRLAREVEPDEDQQWFVRSPWPSITVQEVIGMIWPWVDRPPLNMGWDSSGEQLMLDRMVEVLTWPENRALEWLNTCRANTLE